MRDKLKFYRLSDATFYDRVNTTYQFIKPFLDNKMSIFEEYGAFNEVKRINRETLGEHPPPPLHPESVKQHHSEAKWKPPF